MNLLGIADRPKQSMSNSPKMQEVEDLYNAYFRTQSCLDSFCPFVYFLEPKAGLIDGNDEFYHKTNFTDLPLELREYIYTYYFLSLLYVYPPDQELFAPRVPLLASNSQIRREAVKVRGDHTKLNNDSEIR